ncbi:MAG: DUF1801 domain-containing protein [Spirochaetales bacterium]|nr:DUF1801 domain-containing protein [Spirochaetales bacterium]
MDPVEEYIGRQAEAVRPVLEKVREIILRTAAGAEESISYAMPAYKLYGRPLVYFAAQRKHLGFYATPSGHERFEARLAVYERGKGSVRFPFDKPIPYDLIEEIVAFRVEENRREYGPV